MTIVLTLALIALQLGDIHSTYLFLKQGIGEANGLARKLFAKIGFWPTCLAKLVLTGPMIAYLWTWPQYWLVPFATALVMAWVVIDNYGALRSKR